MPLGERSSNFRRLAVEAIVIVASILAAFALDRWWDARRDRIEEQAALRALQTEFRQARSRLEEYRGINQRIDNSVRTTLTRLTEARDRGESFASIPDTALGLAYIPPTVQLSLGTLEGLLASGRLGILRDRELQALLSSWHGILADLTEEEDDARTYVYFHLDPVLRTRIDVSPLRNAGLAVIEGTLTDEAAQKTTRVPADLETIGVMAGRQLIVQHLIGEFEPVDAHVERTLTLIARSMER